MSADRSDTGLAGDVFVRYRTKRSLLKVAFRVLVATLQMKPVGTHRNSAIQQQKRGKPSSSSFNDAC